MESLWYYARGGQSFGPISLAELKQRVAAGELQPQDSIRKDGTDNWLPANQVPNLFEPMPRPAEPEPIPLLEIDESSPLEKSDGDRERNRRPRRDRDDDDWDDRRAGGGDPFEAVKLHLTRAVSTEMRTLIVTEDEDRRLRRSGIKEPIVQRYCVWRRSMLWVIVLPCGLAAILHFINTVAMEKDKTDAFSRFGLILIYLQMFSIFALPATAALAALNYDRPRKSSRFLLCGAIVAFAVPMLCALVPAEDFLEIKNGGKGARTFFGTLFGLSLFVTLLPTILSILPAIGRACIHVKSLLPTSIAPGWGLLISGPLYVLIGFAAFVLIYHTIGNFLLVAGVLLWVGAPLLYLTRADLLIRPITRIRDIRSVARTRLYVLISVAVGVVLICIFLFTAKFFGETYIVGLEKSSSMMRPWNLDLHAKWIEFLGRSLFLTVLFADLIMRMNLSIWRQEKEFNRSEHAAEYDLEMTDLAASLEPPPAKSKHDDDDRRD